MASLLENMKRTAEAVFAGYNNWDIDAMLAPRTDVCIYQMLPQSTGAAPANNAEFRQMMLGALPLFCNMTLDIRKASYDIEAKTAAFHAFSDADTPVGKYKNEYTWYLAFTEDGKKATRVEKFVDSAYTAKFLEQLQAHIAQHGGNIEAAWARAKL